MRPLHFGLTEINMSSREICISIISDSVRRTGSLLFFGPIKHVKSTLLGRFRCDTHRSNPDLRYPVYIIDTKKHSVYICKIKESKHGYMKILCYMLHFIIGYPCGFGFFLSKIKIWAYKANKKFYSSRSTDWERLTPKTLVQAIYFHCLLCKALVIEKNEKNEK